MLSHTATIIAFYSACIELMNVATDFDPEDLDNARGGSGEESSAEEDKNAGREHYQAVG